MMTLFFSHQPVTLGPGQPLRHQAIRTLLLGPDRAGRLHAVQPVRSVVCFDRPYTEDIDATIDAAGAVLSQPGR